MNFSKRQIIGILVILAGLLLVVSGSDFKSRDTQAVLKPEQATGGENADFSWGMKLVPANVTDKELETIKSLGMTILSGEWGVDTLTIPEVLGFLDRVDDRGMKYVINFSDQSAWGYIGGQADSRDQEPSWQKEKVILYLNKIKNHPAIYGYDISNEAGENLPNGDRIRITANQMAEAAEDVQSIDNTRPIIIRMHYWDDEDGDFNSKNPFKPGIADIVMLNLYSNFSIDGENPFLPNMIQDSGQVLIDKIHSVDPDVDIWLSLAAFNWPDQFITPSVHDLTRDIEAALDIDDIANIGFFGWGERNPSPGSLDWYLPGSGKELIRAIKNYPK